MHTCFAPPPLHSTSQRQSGAAERPQCSAAARDTRRQGRHCRRVKVPRLCLWFVHRQQRCACVCVCLCACVPVPHSQLLAHFQLTVVWLPVPFSVCFFSLIAVVTPQLWAKLWALSNGWRACREQSSNPRTAVVVVMVMVSWSRCGRRLRSRRSRCSPSRRNSGSRQDCQSIPGSGVEERTRAHSLIVRFSTSRPLSRPLCRTLSRPLDLSTSLSLV